MALPGIDAIYGYLGLLIAEREPNEPFLVKQVMPAIKYKFPDFAFSTYGQTNIKEFILTGDRAGYFTLINTGDTQTAYLATGKKYIGIADSGWGQKDASSSPSTPKWMPLLLDRLLSADRADQLIAVIKSAKDGDALTNAFDKYLVAEMHQTPQYPTRGKIERIRQFLRDYLDRGETQALVAWQSSRPILRLPVVPPNPPEISRTQSLIWHILQGNASLVDTPIEQINVLFFAVLQFCKEQLAKVRAWDWVRGLDLLEIDARALPRPVLRSTRSGLLNSKMAVDPNDINDDAISALVATLKKEAGIATSEADPELIFRQFVEASSLAESLKFLEDRPKLVEGDDLLTWIDMEISNKVAVGEMDAARTLANKAALVLGAKQDGITSLRGNPTGLRSLFEAVMQTVWLLEKVHAYLKTTSTTFAINTLHQHPELLNEADIEPLIHDQMLNAARDGDLDLYRQVSDRAALWHMVIDLGEEEGARQHDRNNAVPRTDLEVQTEMGLMLLIRANNTEEIRETLERYPTIATQQGMEMIDGMLEVLSFMGGAAEEYNRHFKVKQLLERCLHAGIDRVLAELK